MANDFSSWLIAEVEERGWSFRELGRRSGLSGAAISDVVRGKMNPGLRFCVQVARAFRIPPENALRRAGLLPPLPPAVEEEREVVVMLRQLPAAAREMVLTQLRAMTGALPGATHSGMAGPQQPTTAGDQMEADGAWTEVDEELERQLMEEFRALPEEWQLDALREMEQLQRYYQRGQRRPRIIGDEGEEG